MKRKSSTPPSTPSSKYLDILQIDKVIAMEFNMLVAHLRLPDTIAVARDCLGEVIGACNTRIFLAAYMIAFKKSYVFEEMNDQSKALFESAVPMLQTFEAILKKKQRSDAAFVAMTREYFDRFHAWKKPDEEKLVKRIKHALEALYNAQSVLPADEPEDSLLKVCHFI